LSQLISTRVCSRAFSKRRAIEVAPEVLPFSDRQAALPAGLLSPDRIVLPAHA
jgi:hypothetical protein